MKHVNLDDFFAVLGNKQRVKILQLLNDEGDKCVGQISETLNQEQSAVSHNLKRLVECHFVEMSVSGKKRIYSINQKTIRPLFRLIDEHVSNFCVYGCHHWDDDIIEDKVTKKEVQNANN